jgi:hypothetical protein
MEWYTFLNLSLKSKFHLKFEILLNLQGQKLLKIHNLPIP